MASSNSPYQTPAHIVQLSVQHIDICARPDSRPASENKASYFAPTALYPQNVPPKNSAVREEHIRKTFMNNLKQYQETSMAQSAKEEATEAPTAKQHGRDDPILQIHEEELIRHRKNSSQVKNHDTRGEECEEHSNKGKRWKQRTKANVRSMRAQKRRSSKKDTIHQKKAKESGDGDNGGDEW